MPNLRVEPDNHVEVYQLHGKKPDKPRFKFANLEIYNIEQIISLQFHRDENEQGELRVRQQQT